MKFVAEAEREDSASDGTAAVAESGRILRYWAGNLHHYELKPSDGSLIYESGYHEVGAGASRPAMSDQAGRQSRTQRNRPGVSCACGRGRHPGRRGAGAVASILTAYATYRLTARQDQRKWRAELAEKYAL